MRPALLETQALEKAAKGKSAAKAYGVAGGWFTQSPRGNKNRPEGLTDRAEALPGFFKIGALCNS